MASTFTPSLALEIPAHGDYSSSGFDTPLDNSLRALDTAYGAYLNLTVAGSPINLTTTQASCPIINVTGSLSANVVIGFPPTVAGRRLIIPACTMNNFYLFVRGNNGADPNGIYFWIPFAVPYGIVVTPNRVYWDYGAVGPGTIVDMPNGFASNGWLPCDGRYVSQVAHDILFDVIGSGYGGGSGTFAVPDLRGTVLAMADQIGTVPAAGPWAVNAGNRGILNSWGFTGSSVAYEGEANHSLSVNEMPSHNHSQTPHAHLITDVQHQHLMGGGYGGGIGGVAPPHPLNDGTTNTYTAPAFSGIAGTQAQVANILAAGGSLSHNNVQPTVTTMKMIKW